ncbi:phospholipid scramblase 1-like isoform X2 [Contarinia nasturtii]|uniref:phospholipid scramblase 1-like isoform X2 n=1 Tax=Contarinia nasturtii TaxID=265458 RepID=UPI0012D41278|nr:phospholipid scramblase 1-like isoform X2 [Contarinia nasturtii]
MEEGSNMSQGNSRTTHLESVISDPIPSESNPIRTSNIDYGSLKAPVTSQPQSGFSSGDDLNGSSGLDYLKTVHRLFIKRNIQCCSQNRVFFIKNELKENVYVGVEDDDCECCIGLICGPHRIKLFDVRGNEVLQFRRFLQCSGFIVEVLSPFGQIIARVRPDFSLFTTKYIVANNNEDILLRIERSGFYSSKFKVLTLSGTQVGEITKRRDNKGFIDTYSIEVSFDIKLNVHVKAALIAASLSIEMLLRKSSGEPQ